jgi:predicted ribosomally synthesized peptide with SipW-like signal peptide
MLRKIMVLAMAAILTLIVTASASWAYFQDTETSAANTITAGTLDLVSVVSGSYTGSASLYHVITGSNGVNGKVVFDKIAPGQSGTIEWVLSNTGSIGGTLTIASTGAFTDGVTATEPESLMAGNNGGDNGDLDVYLLVTLQGGTGVDQAAAEDAMTYILGTSGSPVAISGLETVLDAQSRAMAASGGSDTIVYKLSWSLSNSEARINIVQGDTAQIDITFTLSQ